jgi:perosamine synthetase
LVERVLVNGWAVFIGGHLVDRVMEKLAENGIERRRFFYPAHLMPPYKKYAKNDQLPIAEKLSAGGINLPSGTKLAKKEIFKIVRFIRNIR